MSKTHRMNLQPVFLGRIRGGSKTVEMRLWDEKRRQLAVGDTLVFWHGEGPDFQEVSTRIEELLIFPDFEALVEGLPLGWFGTSTKAEALADVTPFYTSEQQAQWGVVGIHVTCFKDPQSYRYS